MLSLDFRAQTFMRLKIVLFPAPIYNFFPLSFLSLALSGSLPPSLLCLLSPILCSYFSSSISFKLMIWSCVHLQFTFVYCINRAFYLFFWLPFLSIPNQLIVFVVGIGFSLVWMFYSAVKFLFRYIFGFLFQCTRKPLSVDTRTCHVKIWNKVVGFFTLYFVSLSLCVWFSNFYRKIKCVCAGYSAKY